MIPCIMIGDSIAVGVGQARPECETVARVGISSSRYVSDLLPLVRASAGTAVISLGVNDGDTTETLDNLRAVRSRVSAGSVVWLLPGLKEPVRAMIRTVAAENGDRTLDTRPQVGRDHLHPTGAGYERIAASTIGAGEGAVEVAYAPEEPRQAMRSHRRTVHHARALHGRALHGRAGQGARTGIGPGIGAGKAAGHTSRQAARAAKLKPAAAKAACFTLSCRPRTLRG